MSSKEDISSIQSPYELRNTPLKVRVIQKLCFSKTLHNDSWLSDELSEEEIMSVRNALQALMPMDTMVTDMWDWDIRFEDITFEESFFDVAFGGEDEIAGHAEQLKEDILTWIDEYAMDYAQEQWDDDEFEKWVYEQSVELIKNGVKVSRKNLHNMAR